MDNTAESDVIEIWTMQTIGYSNEHVTWEGQ